MQKLGYQSRIVDPDMWIKAEYRPENELEYYSFILCYVDDILCTHHDPDNVLNKLNGYMPLKPSLVGNPNMYFGTKLKLMQLHNDIWAWSISPSKFVQEPVCICKENITKHLSKVFKLPKRADNPLKVVITLNCSHSSYWYQMRHLITSH